MPRVFRQQYTRPIPEGAAVDRLPGLLTDGPDGATDALRATGTGGEATASATRDIPGLPPLTVPLTGPDVVSCRIASEADSGVVSEEEAPETTKPQVSPGFAHATASLPSATQRCT